MGTLQAFDLHIHSNNSDGADSWQTILQRAEEANLECISITDHDNCEVYLQIKDSEKYFSGKIITGIEMQAYFKGLSIEILGYGFDIVKMQQYLQGLYLPFPKVNLIELERLHAKCIAQGMTFALNIIENYNSKTHYYATDYLHEEMRKFSHNKNLIPDAESWARENIFFKRHTSNPNSSFYVDESDIVPAADKVIELIRKAGGKVVLPHVYQYEENTDLVLNGLVESMDGIECFYPSFTDDQTKHLLNLCKKRNLLITGGSDYHGGKRPGKIGEIGNSALCRTNINDILKLQGTIL